METRRIPCQLACVEHVIRRVTAGWRTWARAAAMKTRAEHSSAERIDRWGCLRFRAGQGSLLVEGLALGVLGGVALAWSMGFTRFGADGIPMLGLRVTPLHAGLLLTVGALALLACLGRRSAFIFSALAACGWAALTVVCALQVARHTPGVLGFDPRDNLFYGTLSAYNLATACCLAVPLSKMV